MSGAKRRAPGSAPQPRAALCALVPLLLPAVLWAAPVTVEMPYRVPWYYTTGNCEEQDTTRRVLDQRYAELWLVPEPPGTPWEGVPQESVLALDWEPWSVLDLEPGVTSTFTFYVNLEPGNYYRMARIYTEPGVPSCWSQITRFSVLEPPPPPLPQPYRPGDLGTPFDNRAYWRP